MWWRHRARLRARRLRPAASVGDIHHLLDRMGSMRSRPPKDRSPQRVQKPASEPGCDAAAAAPASDAPTFITAMTGFPASAARCRALITAAVRVPSRVTRMVRVRSSSAIQAMQSATSTSTSLPVATKLLNPEDRRVAPVGHRRRSQRRRSGLQARLTPALATRRRVRVENVPKNPSWTSNRPRLFGPRMRVPGVTGEGTDCGLVPPRPHRPVRRSRRRRSARRECRA